MPQILQRIGVLRRRRFTPQPRVVRFWRTTLGLVGSCLSTLKGLHIFAGNVLFNPYRVGFPFLFLTQGSPANRATLGCGV